MDPSRASQHLTAAQLPAPGADALAASHTLTVLIQQRIAEAGGWLSFADYMRLALYAPGLGYYSGGAQKFGAAGDFITAPEISALFAQSLAQPVAQVLAEAGGNVLEVGAGSGVLAADLLAELERLAQLPERYWILELSAELAQRQRATLQARVPHLLARVGWLQSLPQDFVGCIIGNEVLDAMPCRILHRSGGSWQERGVVWREGFAWAEQPLATAHGLPDVDFPEAYTTEIQPEASAFVASLAASVARGALILIDYGFDAGSYYHPQRDKGTLMCHYRHHSHDDPFYLPGLQDITCHVDFSAIYAAGVAAGWRLEGYTSQAAFLLDAGLLAALARLTPATPVYYQASAAVQKLTSPAEMGELFKVIAFSKGMQLDGLLAGMRRHDRSHEL